MSRSRKKNPYFSDYGRKRTPFFKRQANKRIRKIEDLAKGNSYRKSDITYNICDYKFYCPDDVKAYRK